MSSGRTRVGGYVLCLDDGRLLLVRIAGQEDAAGRWTLPGGGARFGEPPEAAAVREFEEETGLRCELGDVLTIISWVVPARPPHRPGPVHAVGVVYRGRALDGEPRPEVDGSTDRAAWFDAPGARGLPLVPIGEAAVRLAFGGSIDDG